MDSRIEVQLSRTVIMLGPEVTIAFRSLYNELEQNTKPIDNSPLVQARSPAAARKGNASSHTITERLVELQRKGALLAYLFPDTVIDESLGLESFDTSKMDKWMQHERGLMHVFGHYNNTDSMLCSKENQNQPLVSDEFLNATNDKIYICVGFNESSSDLDSFLRQLPREESRHILLPCESIISASRGLFVPCANCYESLCPMGDTSIAIGTMIEKQSCDLAQSVSFILANKTNYVKVAKLVSSLPSAGFQLMSNMEYGGLSFHVLTVEIAVNGDWSLSLQVFWQALVNQPALMESLVKCAVLAVVLDKYTMVWLGGGKLTKSSTRSLTLEELMSKGSNAVTLTNTQSSHSSSVISSAPKQNKIHPRYTAVKKHTLDSKDSAMMPPSSVFRRRMSLPPNTYAGMAPPTHHLSRGSTGINVSSRQQFLLNKHFLNQKNNQGITTVKPEHKRLRQLLQDKPKEYPKPSPSSIKHMTEWISGKRRALFAGETKEWSAQVNRDLEKKLAKWRRFRERQLEKKREEEEAQHHERLRRSSLESNASSTSSDIIRQHLSATAPTGLPIPSPLLTAVNPQPYILPQAANFALRTASMMYHPSYFSSYPLLTTVPMPYLLPNASNLILVSNSSINPSTATITTTDSVKRPSPPIIPLTVPILPQSIPSTSSGSPPVPTVTRSKRKHSSAAGKSYSEISSLLMKKDTDPPAVKQSRMVSSPASLSDDKSDEEEHMSCESSETEDNQLPLWKFLLELLLSNAYSHIIGWTRIHSLEFQLKQPKEVAKLWSSYKSDRSIDYGRFRKGLQFYCTKEQPILNSIVSGEEEIYCFSSSMLYYINNRYSQLQRTELSVLNSSNLQSSREMCGSQEVLVVD